MNAIKLARIRRKAGKQARGIAKTFTDKRAAREQRRLAGIASGKARKRLAKKRALIRARIREDLEALYVNREKQKKAFLRGKAMRLQKII